MTLDETKLIFTKLKNTYIGRFNNMSYQDGVDMLNSWYSVLKNYDFQKINANLEEHIKTSPYFPVISELTKEQKIAGNKFANYEQTNECTKEEWANMVDLYNRYYNKPMKVGKFVDEYLKGVNKC